jgi:hypothetical protein
VKQVSRYIITPGLKAAQTFGGSPKTVLLQSAANPAHRAERSFGASETDGVKNESPHRGLPDDRPSAVPVLASELTWSSEIGRFVINLGMLDYRMFEFLEGIYRLWNSKNSGISIQRSR